jgi:DNA-binding NtrC family response regulator
MQGQRILIVDDEASLRTALFRALDRKGYQVITSSTAKEAETVAQMDKAIDLAIVDLRLPDGDGIELMSKLRAIHANMQVIILTGHASIETAVEATRKGAFHFVTKPCNLDEIMTLVDRALSHSQLKNENQHLRNALHSKYQFDNIIGQSDAIQQVLGMIERVAQSDSTVLIMGESGTGKELVAKAVNSDQLRSDPGRAARKRAFWTRERRLYRCDRQSHGPF